jgi:hypothetical protein
VKNESNIDFESVEVWSKNFEYLPAGNYSDYQTFNAAYQKATVFVTTEDENYSMAVIDYVGEEPLEGGRYTLKLTISGPENASRLAQEMIRD